MLQGHKSEMDKYRFNKISMLNAIMIPMLRFTFLAVYL